MIQLLDTHALLWFLQGADEALPVKARIEERPSGVSVASLWEAAIKVSLGKLRLPYDVAALPRLCLDNGFGILEVGAGEAVRVARLPWHHRDPFDRLIAAQCLEHRLTLVSRDAQMDAYGIDRIWG